jgi:hypothetical protein
MIPVLWLCSTTAFHESQNYIRFLGKCLAVIPTVNNLKIPVGGGVGTVLQVFVSKYIHT